MSVTKKLLAAATAVALMGGTVAATAAPAKRPVAVAPIGKDKSDFAGVPIAFLIAGGLAALVGLIVVVDDNKANSPG